MVIKHFEKLELKAYVCPANRWTIGYGHTGNDIRRGLMISESRADLYLNRDVSIVETCMFNAIKVGIKQHQFDALVCFIFNVGVNAFNASTMLKKLNAGDYAGAAVVPASAYTRERNPRLRSRSFFVMFLSTGLVA